MYCLGCFRFCLNLLWQGGWEWAHKSNDLPFHSVRPCGSHMLLVLSNFNNAWPLLLRAGFQKAVPGGAAEMI